jgi:hypothetical protein
MLYLSAKYQRPTVSGRKQSQVVRTAKRIAARIALTT